MPLERLDGVAPPPPRLPRWSGGPDVHGKRVLVWWEQGFGDTLHFCR
jgi:hypothetical protein